MKKWKKGELVRLKKNYHNINPEDVNKLFVVKYSKALKKYYLENARHQDIYNLSRDAQTSAFERLTDDYFYDKVE